MTQPDSTNKNYELSCTLREVIKKASKYRDSASTKENICIILDDNNKGTTRASRAPPSRKSIRK